MIDITIDNQEIHPSDVIYKLQRFNELDMRERSLIFLETIGMTTSYTKAIEFILDNPTHFLVPHSVNKQKRYTGFSFLEVS